MNKKLFAAVLGTILLCSCGDGGTAEVSETTAESVTVTSAASETTVTTTAVETVSESVSEVSETEEKSSDNTGFFNDDVIFEEVMLPVKVTYYKDGAVDNVIKYEYDAAGNKSKYQAYTYEYDYNQDGTYNSITTFFMGETEHINRFDENGYCIEITSAGMTTNYEYEFDETERLIRKTDIYGDKKENFEYTYDEAGRLYEEFNNVAYYDYSRFRHEYVGNIENIYYFRDGFEEVLWKILEKDENGNIIKETIDVGSFNNDIYKKIFTEYKYDDMNRLIYEKNIRYQFDEQTVEYYYDKNGRLLKEIYIYDSELDESYITTVKYSYSDDIMIQQTYDTDGVLTNETEYAMIPKIKTDIEYKYYNDVKP